MTSRTLATAVAVAAGILVTALLAWLSSGESDPCSAPNADIGAAVLADQNGDQDALINRAIILRALCEREERESNETATATTRGQTP